VGWTPARTPRMRSGLCYMRRFPRIRLSPNRAPPDQSDRLGTRCAGADPQNPELQNAVGYTLADNDQNLDEAEKLLRQALQSLKPPATTNPTPYAP